ncbi:MAG: stage III sporulation protein AF [Novibacillus thermophilus]|uniref:Stage III sporulation protein AF n=1 Tax=Novibacillus thermophilus TaxID=1471761 RepID=A0A1U9K945_9BACL|nr:stage III sporulation protein AF [Novibacillus thermophilus]AQS56589.1 stage III sporulation protein AF [Novibacillus thermophilus]
MSYLASWIQQLVLTVILATFIDLLLPNNTMQRYVRLVMGLVILMLILSPLLSLLQRDWSLEDLMSQGQAAARGELESLPLIQEKAGTLMEKQDEWVSETVKTRIERNIRDGIEQQFDVEVIGVTASLSEGGKHPGVDSVRVTLDPGAHPHGQWEIEPVKPVDIDVEEDREEESEPVSSSIPAWYVRDIREWVSREWHIEDANVQVNIAEEEGS